MSITQTKGTLDNYLNNKAITESGGRETGSWVLNSYGYTGIWQMGEGAMVEAGLYGYDNTNLDSNAEYGYGDSYSWDNNDFTQVDADGNVVWTPEALQLMGLTVDEQGNITAIKLGAAQSLSGDQSLTQEQATAMYVTDPATNIKNLVGNQTSSGVIVSPTDWNPINPAKTDSIYVSDLGFADEANLRDNLKFRAWGGDNYDQLIEYDIDATGIPPTAELVLQKEGGAVSKIEGYSGSDAETDKMTELLNKFVYNAPSQDVIDGINNGNSYQNNLYNIILAGRLNEYKKPIAINDYNLALANDYQPTPEQLEIAQNFQTYAIHKYLYNSYDQYLANEDFVKNNIGKTVVSKLDINTGAEETNTFEEVRKLYGGGPYYKRAQVNGTWTYTKIELTEGNFNTIQEEYAYGLVVEQDIQITESGIMAGMHIGGSGNVQGYLEGLEYNEETGKWHDTTNWADGNNSISTYFFKHGGYDTPYGNTLVYQGDDGKWNINYTMPYDHIVTVDNPQGTIATYEITEEIKQQKFAELQASGAIPNEIQYADVVMNVRNTNNEIIADKPDKESETSEESKTPDKESETLDESRNGKNNDSSLSDWDIAGIVGVVAIFVVIAAFALFHAYRNHKAKKEQQGQTPGQGSQELNSSLLQQDNSFKVPQSDIIDMNQSNLSKNQMNLSNSQQDIQNESFVEINKQHDCSSSSLRLT